MTYFELHENRLFLISNKLKDCGLINCDNGLEML